MKQFVAVLATFLLASCGPRRSFVDLTNQVSCSPELGAIHAYFVPEGEFRTVGWTNPSDLDPSWVIRVLTPSFVEGVDERFYSVSLDSPEIPEVSTTNSRFETQSYQLSGAGLRPMTLTVPKTTNKLRVDLLQVEDNRFVLPFFTTGGQSVSDGLFGWVELGEVEVLAEPLTVELVKDEG